MRTAYGFAEVARGRSKSERPAPASRSIMQRVTHATLLHCEPCYASTGQGGPRIYGGISVVIERYAASSRYLFLRHAARCFITAAGSCCQSNWLRRATKILRCSSPLRGHLHAGDINQCRVFRVPSSLFSSLRSLLRFFCPYYPLSFVLLFSIYFKVISTDAETLLATLFLAYILNTCRPRTV